MIKNDMEELQFRIALDCSPSARRQLAKLEPEKDKKNGTLCKIQMEHRLDEMLGDRVFYLLAGETKYHAQPLRNSKERVKTITLKSPVITSM